MRPSVHKSGKLQKCYVWKCNCDAAVIDFECVNVCYAGGSWRAHTVFAEVLSIEILQKTIKMNLYG